MNVTNYLEFLGDIIYFPKSLKNVEAHFIFSQKYSNYHKKNLIKTKIKLIREHRKVNMCNRQQYILNNISKQLIRITWREETYYLNVQS